MSQNVYCYGNTFTSLFYIVIFFQINQIRCTTNPQGHLVGDEAEVVEAVWRDVAVVEVTIISEGVVVVAAVVNHGQLIKITPNLLNSGLVSISVKRLR